MTSMVPVGDFDGASDGTMALNTTTEGTAFRAALRDFLGDVAGAIIADDPTLIQGALDALQGAIPDLGLMIALPKDAVAQSARTSLPVSWQARTIRDAYTDDYVDVYTATFTDDGTYGGDVPVLSPTGRISESQLPATMPKLDGSVPFSLIRIGQSVILREVRGARGHRLQFISANPGDENARPYMEVNASAEDAYGDVTAGYQTHVTGDGTTPNTGERVYWFMEAHGLGHTINANPDYEGRFSIGVANRAELTERGKGRAMVFAAGNRGALGFPFYKPYVELLANTAFMADDRERPAFGDGSGQNHVEQGPGTIHGGDLINFRRDGALGIRLTGLSDDAETAPQVFMGRSRGSVLAPGDVQAGDRLGAIQAGTQSDVSPDYVHIPSAGSDPRNQKHVTAEVVARATENYVVGTAEGSRLDLDITPAGTAATVTGLSVDEPAAGETSVLVRVNRDGTTTQTRVEIGAPDSGGTGYRALVIPN